MVNWQILLFPGKVTLRDCMLTHSVPHHLQRCKGHKTTYRSQLFLSTLGFRIEPRSSGLAAGTFATGPPSCEPMIDFLKWVCKLNIRGTSFSPSSSEAEAGGLPWVPDKTLQGQEGEKRWSCARNGDIHTRSSSVSTAWETEASLAVWDWLHLRKGQRECKICHSYFDVILGVLGF